MVSAATVTGTSDAILHLMTRDMRHLEAVLERIRGSASIERSESIVVLSNKPTHVLEIIELPAPRPRELSDRELDTHRQKLVKLFRSLEQPDRHKETVA